MANSLWFNILLFIISFIFTLYSGNKLSFYAKLLGAKNKISDFIIGTLLISVITSLPELSSGLSAIFIVKNPNLMIADVFGSNFFNITTLWLVLFLVIVLNFKLSDVATSHLGTGLYSIILPVVLVIGYFIPIKGFLWLSLGSIIFLFFIPFGIKFFLNSNEETKDEMQFSQKYLNYTNTKILFIFLFYSILIVLGGLALAKTSDFIAKYRFIIGNKTFQLGTTFVGGLFLAISTSLPEVTVTFYSIFKYKSIDLAYGNILGSNLFNTIIFLLGDFFTKTQLVTILTKGNIFILAALSVSTLLFLLINRFKKGVKLIISIVFVILYVVILTMIFGK